MTAQVNVAARDAGVAELPYFADAEIEHRTRVQELRDFIVTGDRPKSTRTYSPMTTITANGFIPEVMQRSFTEALKQVDPLFDAATLIDVKNMQPLSLVGIDATGLTASIVTQATENTPSGLPIAAKIGLGSGFNYRSSAIPVTTELDTDSQPNLFDALSTTFADCYQRGRRLGFDSRQRHHCAAGNNRGQSVRRDQ